MPFENRAYELMPLCRLNDTTYNVRTILDLLAVQWVFPEHQRMHRWTAAMNAMFICSLIQNIPIPAIHLCEDYHNTRKARRFINDGGHRLRCIYQYCRNMFSIRVKNENGTVSNVYYDCTPIQASTRKPFSQVVQYKVVKRQKYKCNICKKFTEEYEYDHIQPLFRGGSTEEDNCQALCRPCHSQKTSEEASDRSQITIGTLCDRVMNEEEKDLFLNRNLRVVEYGDYEGDAKEIQREIFDRVQNSATINVNDYISSHTADPLVIHVNRQLDTPRTPLFRMEAVVEDLNAGSNDWWSTNATTANKFAYIVALFTSIVNTTQEPIIDLYHPAKANKLSDSECQKEWKSNASKEQLQAFDKLVDSVCNVLEVKRLHSVQYKDFAVLCHCVNRWGCMWEDAVSGMSDFQFKDALDAWESKSLQEDKILHKMGTFTEHKWTPEPCSLSRKRSR